MTAPLRWLLLATHVPPSGRLGGMVRYVVELATELQRRPDVELHVLTVPPTLPFFADLLGDAGRVHVVPALPTAVRSVLERSGLGVPALRRGFDVVHGTKHLLPRRAGGARRLLTVHDLLPMDRPQDFGAVKRRLVVPPYRASVRDADHLVCVSAATRERLVLDQPAAAARAVVVPLAVSSSLQAAVSRPVQALAGRRFALVVGDASPRKNLGRVVDAWEQVSQADPDAVLAVVGPAGWGVDDRGSRYDALVARGAVVPLGQVDDGALRWLYEHARVVACPSLLEGFGLPSVEALHFGAPLVTSTDGALVEASGPDVPHLSPHDTAAWASALGDAVRRDRPPAQPARTRTWADVAAETVAAVSRP